MMAWNFHIATVCIDWTSGRGKLVGSDQEFAPYEYHTDALYEHLL